MLAFLQNDLWERLEYLSRTASRRSIVVAYLAPGASWLLHLQAGDFLVVDMSDASVKGGQTDPREVLKYLRKGVWVFSVENLHAKVFVFDRRQIVGSSNVSARSRNTLAEAGIGTSDRAARAEAIAWVKSLALAPVTPRLASRKTQAIPATEVGGAARLEERPTRPPGTMDHEHPRSCVGAKEIEILDRQAAKAKRLVEKPAYTVETIRYAARSRFAAEAKLGHHVIEIHREGDRVMVYPPARVLYARTYEAGGSRRIGGHLERSTGRPRGWRDFRKGARLAGIEITPNTEREVPRTVREGLLAFFS